MSDKYRQTVVQAIPGIPQDCQQSLAEVLDSIKNNLETGIGVRTKSIDVNFDRWVRVRDLTSADFWKSIGSPINSLFTPISGADSTPPGEPTNFTVTPGAWVNFLSWTNPADEDLAYVEVWGGQTDDIAYAELLANVSYPAHSWSHPLYEEFEQGWFYWIRSVDFYDNKSDFVGDGESGYEAPGPDSAGEMIDAVMEVLQGFKASYSEYDPAGTYYYGDRVYFTCPDGVDRTYKCIVGGGGSITDIPPLDPITGALDPNWTRSGILIEGDVDGVPTAGVDGNLVVDGTILARSIFVDYLSAIKADLGDITAGSIVISDDPDTPTNCLWFNDSGDGCIAVGGTTKADAYFRVEQDGSVVIRDGGDITLESVSSPSANCGMIIFSGSTKNTYMGKYAGSNAVCIWPETEHYNGFLVGSDGLTANDKQFYAIQLAALDIVLRAYDITKSTYSQFAVNANDILIKTPYLRPDGTVDIGSSSYKFNDLYLAGGISCADILCDDIVCDRLEFSGALRGPAPVTKTTDYTVSADDLSIICNGTGTITLTLPSASTYAGKMLHVKTIAAQAVVSASSNVKPLDSNTAGTAILAATAGKWALLQSDGTNWVIMAGN